MGWQPFPERGRVVIPDRFTRPVFGFHGCSQLLADELIAGQRSVAAWPRSQNQYDWLGHGLYFWEHGPRRAREWSLATGRDGGVVGAHIQLGRCLDLTDTQHMELLAEAYRNVMQIYQSSGQALPENRNKRNILDCLVVNEIFKIYHSKGLQTVRCPFIEGPPAFPGSTIRTQSHIQICVVDPTCILGVFRPNPFHTGEEME